MFWVFLFRFRVLLAITIIIKIITLPCYPLVYYSTISYCYYVIILYAV